MSLSFTVSYNSIPKKVLVLRSSSVSVLAAESAKKHQLGGVYEIWYNGKKVDSSLPLKFTNLVNNCKLVLKPTASANSSIRCKVIHPNGTQIATFTHNSTLSDLVATINLNGNLSVNIVNETVLYAGNEHVKLVELGAVDSTVIRVSYVDEKKKQLKAKEEALINQREHERIESKKLDLKRLKEEEEQKKKETPLESLDPAGDQMQVDKDEEVQNVDDKPAQQAHDQNASSDSVIKAPPPYPIAEQTRGGSSSSAQSEPVKPSTYSSESIKPVEMYRPSKVNIYDNPDDDYEFTLEHAKKYQELIRSSGANRASTQHKTHTECVIRIRFPDRNILQLKLQSQSKFGELVSKIDDNVEDKFKSNYNLKLGYPPFKALALSFELNSKKLDELDDFKSDQIMLIWEPIDKAKGPFLNSTQYKEFNDLPEIQLELHRSQLPDDDLQDRAPASATKKHGKKGVPKWLKINKN